METSELIRNIEEDASLPLGSSERFAGYAVIGLSFRSGHVLTLRRFPASSLGAGYTSIWHRDPGGQMDLLFDTGAGTVLFPLLRR
jgi:hypothetical protein